MPLQCEQACRVSGGESGKESGRFLGLQLGRLRHGFLAPPEGRKLSVPTLGFLLPQEESYPLLPSAPPHSPCDSAQTPSRSCVLTRLWPETPYLGILRSSKGQRSQGLGCGQVAQGPPSLTLCLPRALS